MERHTSARSTAPELERWIDELMVAEGRRFLAEVPMASHLTDAAPIDLNYYLRHRIDTIWRIWLTARTDALALASMIREDYDAARAWSRYAAEELDHDRLFLADLAGHGVSPERVRSIGPLSATRTMVADIETMIAKVGSLPAVAYSLFVEWNAERFSPLAVKKAESWLTERQVAGALRHVQFDTDERHLPMIVEIASRLVAQDETKKRILDDLIRGIARHFRACFSELSEVARSGPFVSD